MVMPRGCHAGQWPKVPPAPGVQRQPKKRLQEPSPWRGEDSGPHSEGGFFLFEACLLDLTLISQHFWKGQCIHRKCGIMSKWSLLDLWRFSSKWWWMMMTMRIIRLTTVKMNPSWIRKWAALHFYGLFQSPKFKLSQVCLEAMRLRNAEFHSGKHEAFVFLQIPPCSYIAYYNLNMRIKITTVKM